MRRYKIVGLLLVLSVASFAFAQNESDVKGSLDHSLFTRMPGYYISDYEVKEFDKFTSSYLSGQDENWEGKVTRLAYYIKTGAKQASMLQIARNYENAVNKINGKILASEGRVVEGKIEKNGGVTYVHVEAFNDGRNYDVIVVETGAMKQEVVADAAALSASIVASGKAAVYGIYFDTGKSVVKPESTPALEEITKLLKQNNGLALYVVGHTDNVGALDFNLKLSADRADAVVKALTGRGIAAARLKGAGVGPYCPVASNRSEEGKAKNRRVELVEQK
ncbi:MAG: OmpA family protein [Candidatus Aminicenantes bacterium]|nr:OmpA family protein [Candidatus Aminicenantes bacterium]